MEFKGFIFKALKERYQLDRCRIEQNEVQGRIPETGKWITYGRVDDFSVEIHKEGKIRVLRSGIQLYDFHRPALAKQYHRAKK